MLISKAEHVDPMISIERSEFLGKILYMDAGAAVHVRRVFVRQNGNSHLLLTVDVLKSLNEHEHTVNG
jgi:hypothetical protein